MSSKSAVPKTAKILESSGNFQLGNEIVAQGEPGSTMVRVEYLGDYTAPFTVRSRIDASVSYRFANNEYHRIKPVFLEDAQYLLGLTKGNDPLYRIVSESRVAEAQSAMTFLGAPIE